MSNGRLYHGVHHDYVLTVSQAAYIRLQNCSTAAMRAAVELAEHKTDDAEVEALRESALTALRALNKAAASRMAAVDSASSGINRSAPSCRHR